MTDITFIFLACDTFTWSSVNVSAAVIDLIHTTAISETADVGNYLKEVKTGVTDLKINGDFTEDLTAEKTVNYNISTISQL